MKRFFAIIFLAALPLTATAGSLINSDLRSDIDVNTSDVTQAAGFEDAGATTLSQTIANVLKVFLSLLGIIFVVLVIKAGYDWFMAQGDAAKVTKAKDSILRATIGLLIILSAYAITYFVFNTAKSLNLVGGSGGTQTGSE